MENNAEQPAYPIQPTFNSEGQICNERYTFEGLTKRELIAAMAMQGILAGGEITKADDKYTVNGRNLDIHQIAKDAVDCAGQLLSQLSKPQGI